MALVTGAHPLLSGTSVQPWGLGWHWHIWRPRCFRAQAGGQEGGGWPGQGPWDGGGEGPLCRVFLGSPGHTQNCGPF